MTAAKAADVVGLYVAPPEKAIVLCVDEKPSIQALERAQGYLKLPNGRALNGQSHNYKRSLKQLEQHIDSYINAYNDNAEPFVWTKKKLRQRRFKGRRNTQL